MLVVTMAEELAKDTEQPPPRCDLDYWAALNLAACANCGDPACERQQQSAARRAAAFSFAGARL